MSKQKDKVLLIVGIGASAGGLSPLKDFVRKLPKKSSMAFVVIQHLDPNHKSMLSDILDRESELSVIVAEEGQTISADTIYVMPPNRYLEIEDGKIKLYKQEDDRGSRKAIDQFFRSLAKDCGDFCAGIVLSGSGSDGTAGLRAIKASGGLVLAQDIDEAEHSSMPRSAVDADIVDKVAAVNEMYALLKQYADHPLTHRFAEKQSNKPSESSGESLEDIAAILKAHDGFQLNQYKPSTVQRRIARRMSLSNTEKYSDYLQLLRDNETERKQLSKDLLINVTDFFRDQDAFKILEEHIIPEILNNIETDKDIRVWVAGCASGEEAYSIAILLLEAIEKKRLHNPIKIFATDIDDYAIKIARKGVYPDSIVAEVPEKYLDKYFFKTENEHLYKVKNSVRDLISFATQNVASDPPFNHMHLISCRNLLIYLKKEVQERVLASFYFSLDNSNYLFLGSSESLGNKAELFKITSKKWRLYQKIPGSNERKVMLDHLHIIPKEKSHAIVDKTPSTSTKSIKDKNTLSRSSKIRRAILETQVPSTLVVNEESKLLYSYGNLDPFCTLPQGEPQSEFSDLIKPAIRSRVRSAFYKAKKSKESISFQATLKDEGSSKEQFVKVKIVPVLEQDFTNGMAFTISFVEESKLENKLSDNPNEDDGRSVNADLEQELLETKAELQNTVEELETSTEELKASHEESLSTNEELQSSNEELEASSEELRSLNEELTTVNAELKDKIEQLRHANDDVENFFQSTDIPTIFLDPELKIQRYTPAAEQLLKMGPKDVDRVISSLGRDLIDGSLIDECNAVLRSFNPKRKEIQSYTGDWFIRQITPYRTEDRRIEGVVLVFQDITELKELSQRAEGREKQQAVVAKLGVMALSGAQPDELIHQAVRQIAHVLDADFSKALAYQPDNNHLLMVSGIGWQEGLVGNASLPVEQDSLAGYTFLSKEPVIVKRLDQDKRFIASDLLKDHKVVSCMTCLINHTNPSYGVLGVYTKNERHFTDDDVNFLQSIANMLSTAIQNKEVQQKVVESERKVRLAKEAGNLAIFDYYVQEDNIIWEPRLLELWGFDESEQVTLDKALEQIHPDDLLTVEEDIKAATSHPRANDYASTYRVINKKSGEIIWLEALGEVFFEDNKPLRIIGMVREVTEKVQQQKAVEQSEMRLRRLIDNMATYIWELDLEGEVVEVNTPTLTDAGIKRDDVINKKFWDTYWWSYDPLVKKELRQAFTTALKGSAVRYDAVARMKDDIRIDLDFLLTPIFNEVNEVAYIIPSAVDITERKKAEAAVVRNEQLIKAVTDSIPNPMFAKDKERRLLFANNATYKACKKQSEEILYKKDEDWLFDQDIAQAIKKHDELVLEKGESLEFEEHMTDPDGNECVYIGTKMPWRDDKGNIIGLVGGFTNITERKKLENNLNTVVAELQEADKKKNEFLSILGHELRNPLAALSGSVEVFASSEPNNPEMLNVMRHSIDNMRSLLDDLLDLRRISHNKIELNKQALDMKLLLKNVVQQTKKQVELSKHKLILKCEGALWVLADAVRLEQIFTNLILNSSKYTPDGGEIILHACTIKEGASVAVSDNGVGIDKTMLTQIFDPFYQVKRKGEPLVGLGIGLALVKNLVELHDGSIRAESEGEGRGATFTVTFPALKQDIPKAKKATKDTHKAIKTGLKVLLIEDDKSILMVMPLLLMSLGCQVEVAENGLSGIAKAKSFQPEAILLDLGLPDMNGHDVGRELRKNDYSGLMVAVSGFSHTESRQISEQVGFDYHIAKPASLNDLQHVLGNAQ